jgi:hypothetical protein
MVRLVAQLDGSETASFDCGPATTAMGVDRASSGELRPSIRVVRAKLRVPAGPTDPWDWKRALDGFDGAMKREGLRAIPSRHFEGAPVDADDTKRQRGSRELRGYLHVSGDTAHTVTLPEDVAARVFEALP